MNNSYQRCTKGIWDSTVPGISFDHDGVSNYSHMYEKYKSQYPRGNTGLEIWEGYLQKIRTAGRRHKYDCIVGVSGGTDSSYLLHLLKINYGLRPLAVTLDNGWSSDISVKNIKNVTLALDIDLETYVIDYEEIKDILSSFIKASLPWVDFPTDHAIKSILYRTAKKEGVKYILIGHDFRSEGTQPNEWTYGDAKQLKYIQNKFGTKKIKSFPNMTFFEHIYLSYFRKIKMIYPFFFIDYHKKDAQSFLIKNYNWEYYGGHHHENFFTKWAITYWMPYKFGMDKRIITYSAQVMSGEITRDEALKSIEKPPCDEKQAELDTDYIIKKLGMTREEFAEYWERPNKCFLDYPSSHVLIVKIAKFIRPFIKYLLPQMPSYFLQLEMREKNKRTI